MTSETVKTISFWIYIKGRMFILMERAATLVGIAAFS
jgi:hypothetical protein